MKKKDVASKQNGVWIVNCQLSEMVCKKYCEEELKKVEGKLTKVPQVNSEMHWKSEADDARFPGCGNAQCCQKRARKLLLYREQY